MAEVRKLLWTNRPDVKEYALSADCAFGRYHISPQIEGEYYWFRPRCNVFEGIRATIDEAKQAAQEHFNAAILSSLDPSFIERMEALEAELINRVSSQHEWLFVEALSEIKASVDGESDQPVKDIIYGLLAEIEALPPRETRTLGGPDAG